MLRWSIGALLAGLPALVFAAQLCWQNPDENVDGTPIDDLATVRLHAGAESGSYTLTTEIPTTVPGESICENWALPAGQWFVAATAIDEDGNESAFSNEVQKDSTGDPTSPVLFAGADCADCQSADTELLIGETGMEITIPFSGHDIEADQVEIEILEYPPDVGAVPVTRATLQPTSTDWLWIPGRAGLYYSRVRTCTAGSCHDWSNSNDQGFLYYVELAAPQGGGIE